MGDERKSGGYTVIDSIRVDDTEIVLAHNPNSPSPYVTWKCHAFSNFRSFGHGHYFVSEERARADMKARAQEERQLAAGWPAFKKRTAKTEKNPHDRSR